MHSLPVMCVLRSSVLAVYYNFSLHHYFRSYFSLCLNTPLYLSLSLNKVVSYNETRDAVRFQV